MTDEEYRAELKGIYDALNNVKDEVLSRLSRTEQKVAELTVKVDLLPKGYKQPCETACELVKRVTVLEVLVSEHHRKADENERIAKDAAAKGVVQIIVTAIVSIAGAMIAAHHLWAK